MQHLTNDFYGETVQRLTITEQCQVYKMHNETGEGMITQYPVFLGVDLLYNDFHMENGFNENKCPRENVMEINHCREGRFECEFKNGDCTYLGAGDLSVAMLSTQTKTTNFPLAHFHGISIVIDIPVAIETMRQVSEIVGGISIDFRKIRNKLCPDNTCFVARSIPEVEHIFSELYVVPAEYRKGYFCIKVTELLLFLSSLEPKETKRRQYFYQSQVQTVKAIRTYMIENVREHFTLEQLSKKFDIPLTSMKNCFKGVYGISIYAYMKQYRVQTAAFLLRTTSDTVTEIANQLGYENPSKFAGVFKAQMGMPPSEYRKSLSKQIYLWLNGVAETQILLYYENRCIGKGTPKGVPIYSIKVRAS